MVGIPFLGGIYPAVAQEFDFDFAARMGSRGFDRGIGIAVDGSDNVYTTGVFEGTVDFDPGMGSERLTSGGESDIFVQKLDSSGALVWAFSMGGVDRYDGADITVDVSGAVYVTGSFSGTADLDPGPEVANFSSAGDNDLFVLKLDLAGNFMWAKAVGGSGSDSGLSIAVDDLGDVYTTGAFSGTVDFDPGISVTELTSIGRFDVFVEKLDASGNFVWAKAMGGTSGDVGHGIAVDGSDNVYIGGTFNGTADFDPDAGTFNLTSAGFMEVFVSKLDVTGSFVWARAIGGSSFEECFDVAVDSANNVYTAGAFDGTTDFDPGDGTANHTSEGEWDAFVSKLDTEGNFLWANVFGGAESERGTSVATDGSGNVHLTGYFEDTVDFDPGPGTAALTSEGDLDIFVSTLDSDGEFIVAQAIGGKERDEGSGIAVDESDNVYITGMFSDTADFDSGPEMAELTRAGVLDIFVSAFSVSTQARS